jgi:hypothetical protein
VRKSDKQRNFLLSKTNLIELSTFSKVASIKNGCSITSSYKKHYEKETQLALARRDNDPENINVNVNEIGNIDAVTLTAVGFGLIAFNFLIFANMGDVGIGGLVARIINTFQLISKIRFNTFQ